MKFSINLPPIDPFRLQAGWPYGYSDQYGAFYIAAHYCGLNKPSKIPGYWQHGVKGPWDQITAGNITGHYPNLGKFKTFVAREDEKIFLQEEGVPLCEAIGLPFIYAPTPKTPDRIPDSLLVMPHHTVAGVKSFKNQADLEKYAKSIASLTKRFSNVSVCLHFGDFVNGYWKNIFQNLGLKCLLGGHPHDKNSIARVKTLMSSFEFVTSNAWGSHIAYSLSLGAKVSIWGEPCEQDLDRLEKDRGQGGRSTLEAKLSEDYKKNRNMFLRGLYKKPWEGVRNIDLGNYLIGYSSKKDPSTLKALFGW